MNLDTAIYFCSGFIQFLFLMASSAGLVYFSVLVFRRVAHV